MKRTVAPLVLFPLLLAACGGSGDGTAGAADAGPSRAPATSNAPEQPSIASSSSAQQDSVAATGTAPPRCEDRTGDSKGRLDLTSVGVSLAFNEVKFTYKYTGDFPLKGSLLFVSSDGHKQYGYKIVDGQEVSHFVFDMTSSKQKNVTEGAILGSKEGEISFAASDVDLAALAGGTATVNVDGDDVDACTLTLD